MESNELLEQVGGVVDDIVAVLYAHGIHQVHLGAIMRLLGVSDQNAAKYDHKILQVHAELVDAAGVPEGTIFH
jgi:hypothetical protein